jgi:hypothetical protein
MIKVKSAVALSLNKEGISLVGQAANGGMGSNESTLMLGGAVAS